MAGINEPDTLKTATPRRKRRGIYAFLFPASGKTDIGEQDDFFKPRRERRGMIKFNRKRKIDMANFIVCLFFSIGIMGIPTPTANAASQSMTGNGVKMEEFIFESGSFAECHASTIEQAGDRLVAAWFGGTKEGHPDVGIWVSARTDDGWPEPVEVANGVQHEGKRYPCWNPVIYQPESGPLLLFYKVGPTPRDWWGMLMTSTDKGETWSQPRRLPEDILGPVKNKPIALAGGDLLCPSSSEHDGWRVHFERTPNLGATWSLIGPVNDGVRLSAIQPTLLSYPDGRMQALCRSKQKVVLQTWSDDEGRSWSPLAPTMLPNPNSGIDGVTLADGRQLLVYNHTVRNEISRSGRSFLNVAISMDGQDWKAALVLEDEPGEFSYPAVIAAADGLVHITYTWKRRRIKHVALDPGQLVLSDMPGGVWPSE